MRSSLCTYQSIAPPTPIRAIEGRFSAIWTRKRPPYWGIWHRVITAHAQYKVSDSHVYCVQQRSESLYILCVWHPRKNRSTVQGSVKGTEVIHFWSDKTGVLHFSVLLCCHKMAEIRTKTILVEFGERRKPITFCSSGDEMRSLKEGIAARCCARLVFSNRHVTWAHCPVEIGRLGRYVDRCWRPRNYPWQECGQDHSGVYACVCVCLHASVCVRTRACVCVRAYTAKSYL